MNRNLLFVDFESFYDGKQGYDLRKMSMVEYVRDSRFKAFGLGYAWADKPEGPVSIPCWISGLQIANFCSLITDEIGWQNIAVVGHNAKFDSFILKEIYGVIPGQYIDTKGMSRAVLGKSVKGHSLQLLAEHFGLESKGIMKTEGLRDLTVEQERELAEYCLHDVELCRQIYTKLEKDFPESQYAPMHRTIDMFVNPKLELNVPLLERTAKDEAKRREDIFKEIGIEKKEFASNKKFPDLLTRKGYEVPTKTSARTGKTIPALALGDPEFLELLESENEELKTLCEARVAAKSTLLETRSAKLAAIGKTGRWPFDVEFSGADQTHRFSGGGGAGGNPQNFTRGSALRTAVQAPKGYELVCGDFSNIELRLVAYLSKDPGLVQAIEKGVDIYCDFASVFYGRRITKSDEKERRFGKTAILGLGYGMGWKKFIKTVRVQTGETLSEKDSRKAIDLYRTRYSKVPALWEKLDKAIGYLFNEDMTCLPLNVQGVYWGKGYIQLPSNLKMRYPNLRLEPAERGRLEWVYDVYKKRNLEKAKLYGGKVLENICQGLAGELCKEAMLKMGSNVTGLVHDEIHVVCKKGLGLMTAQKLKRVMSTAPSWMSEIRLDAEVGIGNNWGESK